MQWWYWRSQVDTGVAIIETDRKIRKDNKGVAWNVEWKWSRSDVKHKGYKETRHTRGGTAWLDE